MRILLLCNNWVGWQITRWLKSQPEDDIVGLVVHPVEESKFRDQIIEAAQLDASHVVEASQLDNPKVRQIIGRLGAEMAISAYYGHILKPEFLEGFPRGCINVHPAYLPHNRGKDPNVWSIVEHTPAGASIHYMDAGVDTGDVITQRRIVVEPIDTGETLYHRLEVAAVELFQESWPLIRAGKISRTPQVVSAGSFHRRCDLEEIDSIELNKNYTAQQLIDIIRARTFAPYTGAFFMHEGRKVFLRLQLWYENE